MSRKKIPISEVNLAKIGGRIAYIRLKNNLSQLEFGKKLNISVGNISGMENHKYDPSLKAIVKILEVFNVDPDWLLRGKGEISRKPRDEGDTELIPNIYKEGYPDDDPELVALLEAVRKILKSGNQMARDALKRNIEYFSQAVKDQGELVETKQRLNEMESRIAALESRLASNRIRENDDPARKREILQKRVM